MTGTDPEDRERLAREVAEEVVQFVQEIPDRTSPEDFPEAMLVTSEELAACVYEFALAALERVREPLEKERDEAIGANILNRNAVARLKAEVQRLDREGFAWKMTAKIEGTAADDADSLRAQLSEACAELEKHKPNCDEDTLCCSCQVRWDSLQARLSVVRAELQNIGAWFSRCPFVPVELCDAIKRSEDALSDKSVTGDK